MTFGPDTLRFLRRLARHNDREWFEANRDGYERQVREPALAFIHAMARHVEAISAAHHRVAARSPGRATARARADS